MGVTMVINVDASYEHNRFAISSFVCDNETAMSFFIPMKFQLDGIWFTTNQVIAELYGIYAAIAYSKDQSVTVYTDNKPISGILNGKAKISSENIKAFVEIVRKICMQYDRRITIIYVPRKNNKTANDISLFMLRSLKKMKTESSANNNTDRVLRIPINFTLTYCGDLYNIYINKDVSIVMEGQSYCLHDGYYTNSFNGCQFKQAFNWLKNIRKS